MSEMPNYFLPWFMSVARWESAYRQSLARLWHDGRERRMPFSAQALGASLAISTSCYTAIGGLPTPVAGEDKALARLAREHGYGVIQSARARVITSGRIEGAASGGVSDALRERMTSGNPACDEALVPVALLRRRARVWNALAGSADAGLVFERRCEEVPQLSHTQMRRLDGRASWRLPIDSCAPARPSGCA